METSTECESEPLVPVIRSVNVPVEAVGAALTVNVDVAVLPDGGVIGLGRPNVTLLGADPTHEGDKVTAELNPFTDVTVMTAVLLAPWFSATVAGDDPIVKSGTAAGSTVRVNVAECDNGPLVPVMVIG